jgi:DNA-binding transcriptional MerR regulator
MDDKGKLLSIGEMAKLTGAGIKALRHYEKINILKPAYVDEFTGYRYYRFCQTHIIELIRFAVELDIPLKELTKYVDEDGTMDFGAFVARGNEVVREKMKNLERALKFFDFFDEKLALQREYSLNQIYTRKLPRKIFYTIPYEKTFSDMDKHEVAKIFLDMPYDENNEGDGGWVEYGFMSEYSAKGIKRYVFVEVTHDMLLDNSTFERKIIPSGKYFCRQMDENQIEQVAEIFKEYLAGKSAFLAIETEVFLGKYNINNPINELRVIIQ